MGVIAQKEWRKKQKNDGFCVDCKRKSEPGKIRCQYHLEYQVENWKKRRFENDRN